MAGEDRQGAFARGNLIRVLVAATRYFSLIFALGFVLGAVRVSMVAPVFGAIRAVLIESPLMLAASAWWARRVLCRCGIKRLGDAAAMGLIAFAELMLAELVLAWALAGKTPWQWLADMAQDAGLIGLGAQLGFALIPALILLWRNRRNKP